MNVLSILFCHRFCLTSLFYLSCFVLLFRLIRNLLILLPLHPFFFFAISSLGPPPGGSQYILISLPALPATLDLDTDDHARRSLPFPLPRLGYQNLIQIKVEGEACTPPKQLIGTQLRHYCALLTSDERDLYDAICSYSLFTHPFYWP